MNTFETFRPQIKLAIREQAVKKSKDGNSVSYNWSFAPIIIACQGMCNVPNESATGKAPAEFRKIVQFELDKFRESILNEKGEGWEHVRTRTGYALSATGAKAVQNDRWQNELIPYQEQEIALGKMLDAEGKKVDKTQEDGVRRRKKMNAIIMRLQFVRNELKVQSELVKEVAAEMKAEEIKTEVPTQVKQPVS